MTFNLTKKHAIYKQYIVMLFIQGKFIYIHIIYKYT